MKRESGLEAGGQQESNQQAAQNQLLFGPDQCRARRLAHFYQDKSILITGATGFIGKVCLLKLMSCLGNCSRIYVMLRPKRGLSPQQRFNKMLNEAPFNPKLMFYGLLSEEPKGRLDDELAEGRRQRALARAEAVDWTKVVAVDGDMSCQDLGLADDIKARLCREVNIVFNIAASVQFDAPLKQNLRDNYLGARNLLQLATNFRKLISLIHVSTFYVNHHIKHVEEKVLPMNRDCEKMAELIQWVPDTLLDSIWPQIMENRPNTYIFTKAMSENLVQKFQGQLPVAIVRPSIVVPSLVDPEPGWVDNVNGPMGLGVLGSLGILRNIDWNYWGVCDFIPVDVVVNSMLAIAERTARLYPNEIKVYNCSTSSLNPTTWGSCFETLRAEGLKSPPYKMLRTPIEVPRHKRANRVGFAITKLSELFFAYLIDFVLLLCGQKQLLTKLTSKLHHGYDILKPFTTNEYTCSNDNLLAAFDELNPEDQEEFCFDIRSIDWEMNFRSAYYGARKRILKESLSNVSSAVLKMRVLQLVEFTFKWIVLGYIAYNSVRLYSSQFGLPAVLSVH